MQVIILLVLFGIGAAIVVLWQKLLLLSGVTVAWALVFTVGLSLVVSATRHDEADTDRWVHRLVMQLIGAALITLPIVVLLKATFQ